MPEIAYNEPIKKVSRATVNSRDVSHRSKPVTTSNHTTPPTYCVYRIVCFQTGKVYVGKALNPKIRRKAHFVALKAGRHHSAHLQHTYNKYGREAFYFEIIERDIPAENIDAREIYWIAFFDSYHNGFNGTSGGSSGTHSRGVCTWNGITYASTADAARANNISFGCMFSRIKRGYTCDTDLWKQNKSCTWNGIEYSTLTAAAKANGIHKGTMAKRIKNGFTCDDDLFPYYNGKPCYWNGIAYENIPQAAAANNCTVDTMQKRLDAGYTCDADLKKWHGDGKPCTWNGIEYPSISAAATVHNITFTAMWNRLKAGYTCDTDMQRNRINNK